eukprot:Gregarina_sp_Poly_1__1067@NODE_1261_length_4583_cov_29_317095_g856_i0_p2_GENE_NODE_1261_length_4583_cov_29_317095_g856_i0NODE_1261_length_4583_cov_29_317095_g856_i0_p2_ORF_typecomplete_len394_score38_36Orn_Arg_deC_N/PF02784_16/4_5e58Orn_DAP_Arg_deC/PF00278_22/1_3e24Ala_racemase_N/PF01168_20/3_4e08_NODE_1261_length_4583_cov_29_317095_g856_i026423823
MCHIIRAYSTFSHMTADESNFESVTTLEQEESPCLIVNLDVVRTKYLTFEKALPETQIYYAVKTNAAWDILSLLNKLGASFEVASVQEIQLVLQIGAAPSRLMYGNPSKKERDIARAYDLGVRLFVADCELEVDKIARAAPGTDLLCRLACDGRGSTLPLQGKFGCGDSQAVDVLERAHNAGLHARGVSFHVGSQQEDPTAWEEPIARAARVFQACCSRGLPELSILDLGGGFPACYKGAEPDLGEFATAIRSSLDAHFGSSWPQTIIEPGRGIVGDAGRIYAEVVLVSERDGKRWVHLDVGKYNGLVEASDDGIRFPIVTSKIETLTIPCILAGPTCDSADVLYRHKPYHLPASLSIGDKVVIGAAGAYTVACTCVCFNGFPALRDIVRHER